MKKMKSIFYLLLGLMIVPFFAPAQENNTPLSLLINQYYAVKDALVKSDAAAAAKAAAAFTTQAKAIDVKALAAGEQAAFKNVQAKLLADAGSIAASKDLAKQRAAFQTLSENIITLTKTTQVSKPAYIAYCPMKKAYWVSAEPVIKNPYYGSSMLNCGNVTDTLK